MVNGCYWHRHVGCPNCTQPETRPEFWNAKFAATVARDRRIESALRELGWRVETIWECETEDLAVLAMRIRSIVRAPTEIF
jgi:DNA mismatch endonuclease (patch repair protein)